MFCSQRREEGREKMPRNKFEVKPYLFDAMQMLCPPEQLTVSEWAEKYRVLDSKSSAMPGAWSNSVTPYLAGVMDLCGDKIIGVSMGGRMTKELVIAALQDACQSRVSK